MIRLLMALVLMSSLLLPVKAEDSKFLAIYSSPDLYQDLKKGFNHHVDYWKEGRTFDDFPEFCREVKKRANGRDIVIDLDVHGTEVALLVLARGEKVLSLTNMGYILNKIDSEIGTDHITLITEACFAPYCFRHNVRGNIQLTGPNLHTENHEGQVLYPVYGISRNVPNRNGLVLEQYLHNKYVTIIDLRTFEDTGLEHTKQDPTFDMLLVTLLMNFYKADHGH